MQSADFIRDVLLSRVTWVESRYGVIDIPVWQPSNAALNDTSVVNGAAAQRLGIG
jgi:hypothetical protein